MDSIKAFIASVFGFLVSVYAIFMACLSAATVTVFLWKALLYMLRSW